MKRTVRFTLNSRKFGSQTTIEGVHVGDDNSCELIITITDGNKTLDLSSETTVATMCGTKPDGTVISRPCSIVNNNIVYTLEKQDTAVSGNVLYQVTIASDNGISQSIIATAKFTVAVMKNIYIPIYRVLKSEPADWSTNYTAYYRLLNNRYVAITDSSCPTFLKDTFYNLVNPNYDSKDDYGAFYSALVMVENLIGRASDLKAEFDNINNNIDLFISKYLNAHPELTTTVQDGAITEEKFTDVLKLKKANFYKNVAEMITDTSLKPGMTAVVLGYYEPNDGGAAEYYIGENGNITLDAFHLSGPANNIIEHYKAQIVIKPQMNVECFGAKGDGTSDDSSAIEAASAYDTQLLFKNKSYLITRSICIYNGINWVGNGAVIKLADSFNVNLDTRSAIRINGESSIVGVNIEYQSQFAPNDGKSSVIILKVTSGKNHVLKDVSIDITEKDGVAAEVSAIWYDFAKRTTEGEKFEADDIHNLYVSNCKISNLSTGHDTATSCLWGTGIFDNAIIEKSQFSRNHLGEAVNFWANNETIKNILISGCIFNLTNNTTSGAGGLNFGASFKSLTKFENINIINTIFNLGEYFGNACIGCATPGVEINIDGCKFFKDYPDDTVLPEEDSKKIYFKRLMLFQISSDTENLTKSSTVNISNCSVTNKKGPTFISDLYANSYNSDGSLNNYGVYTTKFYLKNSSISSYSHVYNAADVIYTDCNISIDNPDDAVRKALYFLSSTNYYLKTVFINCDVGSNVKIKGNVNCHGSSFNDTTAFLADAGDNISLTDNKFEGLSITAFSDSAAESPVISELIMKNNIISVLNFKNNDNITSVDNLDTFAISAVFVNNISNKTMLANVIK